MSSPAAPTTFARLNSRGLIEIVDVVSGRILCVQTSPRDLLAEKLDNLTRIDTPQGPVWIERGINLDIVNHIKTMPYSEVLGDLLCQYITEGESLVAACKKLNLEYADVKRWERTQESFKESLKTAQRDRADYLHDEILQKAREKADVKTEIDTLKWAAGKGNPEKYEQKPQKGELGGNSITFVIGTGISRDPVALATDVTPKESDGSANG
jgi:hypothetical protein